MIINGNNHYWSTRQLFYDMDKEAVELKWVTEFYQMPISKESQPLFYLVYLKDCKQMAIYIEEKIFKFTLAFTSVEITQYS